MNKPKFRAWVTKNKGMYGVYGWNTTTNEIYLCSLPDSAFKDGVLHTVHSVARPLDEVILMQYTGQKDKNGVEIYEGDVIASQNKDRKNWKISHHEIVWHDAGFMGKQICSSSFIGIDYWTRGKNGYVVIGNIHENPELLNEVE